MQEAAIFFEPQDDYPTYANGEKLLVYARSHSAMQFLVQHIRDFNQLTSGDHETSALEYCVDAMLREIEKRDELANYKEIFRSSPVGITLYTADDFNGRVANAHAFLLITDAEWLAIAAATYADVFFVALARFAAFLGVDFYRILSILQPAIVDRAWGNACDEKRVVFIRSDKLPEW